MAINLQFCNELGGMKFLFLNSVADIVLESSISSPPPRRWQSPGI